MASMSSSHHPARASVSAITCEVTVPRSDLDNVVIVLRNSSLTVKQNFGLGYEQHEETNSIGYYYILTFTIHSSSKNFLISASMKSVSRLLDPAAAGN